MDTSLVQKIKELTNEKGITLAQLERTLNFSNGSIARWNKSSPSIDKVDKVAKYFNISLDYLLGKTSRRGSYIPEENTSASDFQLTAKDQIEIDEYLENFENELLTQTGLMFDGEPMTNASKEKLIAALRIGAEMAKMEAKEKYTPKKYRK